MGRSSVRDCLLDNRGCALRFIFETFGERNAGSSRLRAWKLADEVRRRGYTVWIGDHPARASEEDVWVFQKRRNVKLLQRAKDGMATVVFDFDDNYLLGSVGTRTEIMAFMNEADLVTVGSQRLWEEASRLHERVWLFENPLDVEDESVCRGVRGWQERIVWFGNRTNLPALESLSLPLEITTITNGGDIEWDLNSIDEVLCGFDLALIPMERSEWRESKNANRLLKCIALGLPAVASATGEHRRIANELDLPEVLMVKADDAWADHITAVANDYCAVRQSVVRARELALGRWGTEKIVDSWLKIVMETQKGNRFRSFWGVGSTGETGEEKRSVFGGGDGGSFDVVVVGDGPSGDWRRTLQSVFAYGEPRRVSVVTYGRGDPGELTLGGVRHYAVSDPFEMYNQLSNVLQESSEKGILVLRAGSELQSGFVGQLGELGNKCRALGVFSVQVLDGTLDVSRPPRFLHEALVEPYMPACWFVSGDLRVSLDGNLGGYGALIPWFILIRGLYEWDSEIHCILEPVVGAGRDELSAGPVHGYWKLLGQSGSDAAADLPRASDEWRRLLWVWNASVVEDCKDAFGAHAASVVPELQSFGFERGRSETKSGDGGRPVRREGGDPGGMSISNIRTRAVRGGWVALRSFVPATVRETLFQKYKDTYYYYFPERRPIR